MACFFPTLHLSIFSQFIMCTMILLSHKHFRYTQDTLKIRFYIWHMGLLFHRGTWLCFVMVLDGCSSCIISSMSSQAFGNRMFTWTFTKWYYSETKQRTTKQCPNLLQKFTLISVDVDPNQWSRIIDSRFSLNANLLSVIASALTYLTDQYLYRDWQILWRLNNSL